MPNLSPVEQKALEKTRRKALYPPGEKISVIEVDTIPLLGKLTALRFLEWVQANPGGVISLPTGKTPEYFIKWTLYYLKLWESAEGQKEIAAEGLDPAVPPDMRSLQFVQMDEFYPIQPTQKNSFYYYVKNYYIDGLGLDPQKAQLINVWNWGIPVEMSMDEIFPGGIVDLTLRSRKPVSDLEELQQHAIEAVDQFCSDYESRIREKGGIGFFLGGIGPDGHIGFNIRGSDLYSTTRLTAANYETQAAAAGDLGGIEIARNRLIITIGLSTITFNKKSAAVIMAAGEAKAGIIARAVESEKSNLVPASCLQDLPLARFYLTRGAARDLSARNLADFRAAESLTEPLIHKVIIDLAVKSEKRIRDLSRKDLNSDPFTAALLERTEEKIDEILAGVEKSLMDKIEAGTRELVDKTILHTAPHHDDIMLGYLPYIFHLVRTPKNIHHFTYMTSGFNAVTNSYALRLMTDLLEYMDTAECRKLLEENYFRPGNPENYDNDVYSYLDGVAAFSEENKKTAVCRRMLRNLTGLYEEETPSHLKDRIGELIDYFRTQYPGKKDLPHIQTLKGKLREWEADVLWAHFGFNSRSVHHLALGFYKGDIFSESPDHSRDIGPILDLMHRVKPNVVTLAMDPEGSGPDTHYKVMQAMAAALMEYEKTPGTDSIQVWGYRNVWHRFHPAEANVFVPVSLNSMAILENAFQNSFGSQREASFPSPEYDGPFSRLAMKIQAEQFHRIKICLGADFFNSNPHPRIRACHGLCFLRSLSTSDFLKQTLELQSRVTPK